MTEAGIVVKRTKIILFKVVHLILSILSDTPAPTIADITIWVELTGPPSAEDTLIIIAEESWAEKPSIGLILYIFCPSVFIILPPPATVPIDITAALAAIIHIGMLKFEDIPKIKNTIAMSEVVFWESLAPWLMATTEDIGICNILNILFILGLAFFSSRWVIFEFI